MRRAVYFVATVVALSLGALSFMSQGDAADLNANKVSQRHISRSEHWQRKYYRCPDRLSCYPLYGAYGPYGGVGYWGAYSYSYDGY